jgi:hypothetical protein
LAVADANSSKSIFGFVQPIVIMEQNSKISIDLIMSPLV